MDIRDMLETAVRMQASDLHIVSGSMPMIRVNGELQSMGKDKLFPEDTKKLIYGVLTEKQKTVFEEDWELDFSLGISGVGRFRVNVHRQRGSVEAAFRVINPGVPSLEQLGLPRILIKFCRHPHGLVLITGPTGTGKSTTMAAMIDRINAERRCLIVSIEDPIEYLHHHKKSIVKQREVYSDTRSFTEALKHVLRQDPDVIVIGEMRDLETISTALTAAETGHLVLATLHTVDATQTLDRIIDVFPAHQQQQIKIQLSSCLQGIISQILLPRMDGAGQTVACEILVNTPAISALIRHDERAQIPRHIQTGGQYGMQVMDASLKELVKRMVVKNETAKIYARHPEQFDLL